MSEVRWTRTTVGGPNDLGGSFTQERQGIIPLCCRKHKRPPSPPSEDFGDSEYSEEVSSKYDRSPAPASPMALSEDSDDSMGLSVVARAYWRSIKCAGLSGSDDSKEASSEEVEDSPDSNEWSGGEGDGSSSDDDGKGNGDDGGGGSDNGDSGEGDGKGDGEVGNSDDNDDDKGDDDGGDGKADDIMLSA
jgi:hypothetical protein